MNQKVSLVLLIFAILAALVGAVTFWQSPGSVNMGVFVYPALLAVLLTVNLLRRKK